MVFRELFFTGTPIGLEIMMWQMLRPYQLSFRMKRSEWEIFVCQWRRFLAVLEMTRVNRLRVFERGGIIVLA
jgi:hypothetical protein